MADQVSKFIFPVKSGDKIELKEFEIRDAKDAAGHLQAEIDDLNNNKAPTSHSSKDTTYGIGTATKYGHCKTINALTQSSHADGTALSAYQGKILADRIGNIDSLTTDAKTSLVAAINEVDAHADTAQSKADIVQTQVSDSSDAYNPTKSYGIGDLCIYNNVLYRCTTACSAGSWATNQSCFTQDTLVNIQSKCNSDLTSRTILENNSVSTYDFWNRIGTFAPDKSGLVEISLKYSNSCPLELRFGYGASEVSAAYRTSQNASDLTSLRLLAPVKKGITYFIFAIFAASGDTTELKVTQLISFD